MSSVETSSALHQKSDTIAVGAFPSSSFPAFPRAHSLLTAAEPPTLLPPGPLVAAASEMVAQDSTTTGCCNAMPVPSRTALFRIRFHYRQHSPMRMADRGIEAYHVHHVLLRRYQAFLCPPVPPVERGGVSTRRWSSSSIVIPRGRRCPLRRLAAPPPTPAVVHTRRPRFVVPRRVTSVDALAVVVLAVVVRPVVVVLPQREAQQV